MQPFTADVGRCFFDIFLTKQLVMLLNLSYLFLPSSAEASRTFHYFNHKMGVNYEDLDR